MRRQTVWLICLLVCVFLFPTVAVAEAVPSDKTTGVIFEAPQITDLTVLESRARAGISDFDDSKIESVDEITQLTGDKQRLVPIETLRTTQKIRQEVLADGSLSTDYVTTEITTLGRDMDKPSAPYYYSDVMKCYLRIYWNQIEDGGLAYGKVLKTSVLYQRLDSQYGIRDVKVRAMQAGFPLGGGLPWVGTTDPEEYDGVVSMNKEYFCKAGSNWPHVYYSAMLPEYYLGAWQGCKVFRGTTTWSWSKNYTIRSY